YEKYATEKWRSRSVQNVIDEIVMLNRKFGATKFDFIDDNFLGSSRKGYLRAIELSNKLQDLDIDFEFSIDLRLELISEELIEEWEKVGLKNVMIGVESINKFDQDIYNKRINIDLIKEKINILNKFNIKYKLGTILWNPYTTYESLQENFDLLKELNYLETNLLTKVNVYKGTQIYTSLKKMLMGNFYDYTWNFVYAEINELYNVLYKNIALAHFLMNKCKFSNKVEKNIYINNMIFVNNMIRTKKQNEHKKIIDKYQRYLLNILEVSNKDVKKIERN